MYDIIIVGGGVTGVAVAREISRYYAKVCLIEREEDLCCGTSKANSAIIHAGYDAHEGSLKAKLNVEGSSLVPQLATELDFQYENNGSMVVCVNESELPKLQALLERGIANGVQGLKVISGDQARALEPSLSAQVVGALHVPTGGIVCPFGMTIALGENAAANGVEFHFNTTVTGFVKGDGCWTIHTTQGDYRAKCIVNAAGVYSDMLHNMVSSKSLKITPRRGEYMLLDKDTSYYAKHTIFQLPGKLGKGVLVTPTVHGNTLVGPTALDIDDREGTNTTMSGMDAIKKGLSVTFDSPPLSQVITSFAGLRAHEQGGDFYIGEADGASGFFDCVGIESPGLSAAPAIGKMLAGLLQTKLKLEEKKNFIATRKGIINPAALTFAERQKLIADNPIYGRTICRCEGITEGEIRAAICRPLGAKSLDGVKRRVRAGMGRCQGGFCAPKVMEILAEELGQSIQDITKCGGCSKIIVGHNKDAFIGDDI